MLIQARRIADRRRFAVEQDRRSRAKMIRIGPAADRARTAARQPTPDAPRLLLAGDGWAMLDGQVIALAAGDP